MPPDPEDPAVLTGTAISARPALDDRLKAPIAHLHGRRPTAPEWFDAALAQAPERAMVPVEGAGIEMLTWGRRGDPGLLLLHGFAAHADWWSFIAPQLLPGRRIAAMSFSGMGGSDWRERYSMRQNVREVMSVAEAAGLFEGPVAPVILGHSFGSYITRACAHLHSGRLGGVVLLDGPLDRYTGRPPETKRPLTHRVYPTLEAALARFRFVPAQTCVNDYAVDFIARGSLRRAVGEDGAEGWTWRFDPALRSKMEHIAREELVRPPPCPTAVIYGARSHLAAPDRAEALRTITPEGTTHFDIPDAGHHVMADQPLALVTGLRGLLAAWPPHA